MKTLIKALGIILLTAGSLFSWTGSDPTIQIVSPDGVNDNSVVKVPLDVEIKQTNTTNGIDFGRYCLVEETGSDTTVSQTEWDARVQIPADDIEDINRSAPLVIDELGADKLKQNTYYYIIGVGKDLNGDASCDTTLIPDDDMKGNGDSTISDTAIARFYVSGYR